MQFCEVITVAWLKDLSGVVVRILLDYVDHVALCSKLKAAVMEQKQWPDICSVQGEQTDGVWGRAERRLTLNVGPCRLQKTPVVCSTSAA